MWRKPDTVDVWVEAFQWLTLAVVLPHLRLSSAGASATCASACASTNDELGAALGTIQRMASHDSLTGLPNRVLFSETLEHALAPGRAPRPFAGAPLHGPGPLQEHQRHARPPASATACCSWPARRIAGAVRDSDIVARLGGDEYVVLIENYRGNDGPGRGRAQGHRRASRARSRSTATRWASRPASASAPTRPTRATRSSCVANADAAMYRAKDLNPRRLLLLRRRASTSAAWTASSSRPTCARPRSAASCASTTSPRSTWRRGRIAGVEALLRWRAPALGPDAAGEVHPARRGDRAHRPHRLLDRCRRACSAGAGLERRGTPGDLGRGEPLRAPVPPGGPRRAPGRDPQAPPGLPRSAPGARDHREHGDARPRRAPRSP